MHIELDNNEAGVLTGLIDIAVKAAGLQVAEAAVALSRKIAAAAQAEQAASAAANDAPAAKPTKGAKA